MQRRLAAILHADVAGYSRLMAGDERGTLADLKSRFDILGNAIARHGGRICNTAGDAVLAEFPSVSAAVSSAVEAQRGIGGRNEGVPAERRLSVRIGINLGEVMAEDDGQVYGTGVNVAARLQGLAEPGGIAISGRAREQVDQSIDVRFVPLGEHHVKNIPTPVRVFRVVSADEPVSASPPLRWRRRPAVVAAVIAALVIFAGGLGLWSQRAPEEAQQPADPLATRAFATQTRLAVLPFRNASGDAGQDYFADAISEDLRSAIGRFAEIAVIADEAMAAPDGGQKSPQQLRMELGVAYVLSGSIRRDGETVRLFAKLIDAESGLQLWSEHYNRPIDELFDVEDEIVRTIAGEAAVTLSRAETARVFGKASPHLEAYDLYIRGRALVARETRDDNIEARELFRKAIEEDPDYALAYVGLARTHYREATRGWSQFMDRNIAETERLARRALQLDPNLAEGYEMLGWASLLRGKYEQSEAELRKAVELNPNSLGSLQALGNTLTFIGDARGAIQNMEKAVSLGAQPSSRSLPVLGLAYVLSGDPQRAIRFLETYARERRDHFYYATLAIAHAELGDTGKAEAAARETLRAWPFFDAEAFARQFRDAGDQRRIAEDLHKAGLNGLAGNRSP